jgi:S-formylglutathione hydrolase FrmB
MSLCDVHWHSQVLKKKISMSVILPEVGTPPFATYYLLHGLSDDHTTWVRRTRVEWYVRELPLIVVMPDGLRGFYTDNHAGPPFAKYVAEEVVPFVERNFPAKRSRGARAIGGLSMGGYGALRLSLGYSDLFASANSHSGAVMHGNLPAARPGGPLSQEEFEQIFGPSPHGTAHDLVHLAATVKRAGKLPKLLIDCGIDDYLLDGNREFHAALERLGVPHEYREFTGAHTWDYWDEHVKDAIAFHCEVLGIAPQVL